MRLGECSKLKWDRRDETTECNVWHIFFFFSETLLELLENLVESLWFRYQKSVPLNFLILTVILYMYKVMSLFYKKHTLEYLEPNNHYFSIYYQIVFKKREKEGKWQNDMKKCQHFWEWEKILFNFSINLKLCQNKVKILKSYE